MQNNLNSNNNKSNKINKNNNNKVKVLKYKVFIHNHLYLLKEWILCLHK